MSKTIFKQPERGQMILAISNGDGSYQMIAMSQTQASLLNMLIASVTSETEPLLKSPIKLIHDDK